MNLRAEAAGRMDTRTVSRHARRRMKDRSIPASIVDALVDFGERASSGGGTEICYFNKRSWRAFAAYLGTEARHFERYRSAYVILSGGELVITACWHH